MRKGKKLLKILRRALYDTHDELIFERDLNKEFNISYDDNVVIQQINEDNADTLVDFYQQYDLGGRNPAYVVKHCLELHHKCYVALKADKIMGYVWWGDQEAIFDRQDPDEKFLDDGIITLLPGELYVFFVFVSPEFRSRNTAIKFMLSFVDELKKDSYAKLYGYVAANNLPAYYIFKLLGADIKRRIPVQRICLFLMFKNKKFYWDRAGHKEFIRSLKNLLKKK